MHRFYLQSLELKGEHLIIEEHRIVFQCGKVLRMRTGDFFQVFDGQKEWLVQIEEINPKRIITKKVQDIQNKAEPKVKVSLYQAIPKKPALFELVVQKATEIGVSEIFPLVTERTEKHRLGKFQRLEAIAMEATEQCGRMKIPVIRHPAYFNEIIGKLSNGFIAYEYEGSKHLADYEKDLKGAFDIQLIIGPEGGLTEGEIEIAKASSVKPFTMGTRILRTETAAIAALSLMMLNR